MILTSEYYCKDTITLFLPDIMEDVSFPAVNQVPDVCLGGNSLDLATYVSGDNLTWYTSDEGENGTNAPPALDTNTPGSYRLWVSQTINGCEGPLAEVNYTILEELSTPTVYAVPNICVGENAPDLGNAVLEQNILWYSSQTGGGGTPATPLVDSNNPGTFRYWVSQTSGLCESERAEVSITVVGTTAPNAPAPLDLCFGDTPPDLADLVPGAELRWYSNEVGGTGNAVAPIVNTDRSGMFTYWVSQVGNDCESPRVEVSYSVAAQVAVPLVIGTIASCEGDDPTNLGTIVSGDEVRWYPSPDRQSGSAIAPATNTGQAGTFSHWVTQREEDCESEPIEVRYTINPIPEAPAILDIPNLCIGDAPLDLAPYLIGEEPMWFDNPGSGNGFTIAPIIIPDSAGIYPYWVSQTILDCESPRSFLEVLVTDISVNAGGPYKVIEGNTQEIQAVVTVLPEDNFYSIAWQDASGTIFETDQLSTTVAPNEPTFYTITAESNGCIDMQEVLIDLIYLIDPTKVFSPNGDGRNDSWFIGDIDKYPESTLTIYNRWGSEVFQTQGYNNDWQGTWNGGEDLPVATYYYVINLNNEDQDVVTGSVTIIR